MMERSASQHIVLIGIGHTNAHIVRMWGMNPIPDTDLTCISDNTIAAYSGRLPAVLAGQVPPEAMQIDLVRLCSSVGARLITDPVTSIDHDRRQVQFADRPSVSFDALSIGVGSIPTISGVSITGDSLIKIKPMQSFLQRLEAKVARLAAETSAARSLEVVVVGSGVAGIEILFCLPNFLKQHYHESFEMQLVTRSKEILPTVGPSMRGKVTAAINQCGYTVRTDSSVVAVDDEAITLADGTKLQADLVIWATGATAPPCLDQFGLELTDRGFIQTDPTLQSTSRKRCFAVGDTGTIRGQQIPKAGVYAVRQGPILWDNLQRTLAGKPLHPFYPQRSFLKLLNTGDGSAVGQWKGFGFAGQWAMRLKERIDSQFMKKYQVDGSMMMSSDGDDDTMQCRGCGCKLGGEALDSALAGSGDEPIQLEDAAVISEDETHSLIASTDFFTSPFADAYLTGRIAALHSASDIIASGGEVSHALGNVVLAEGSEATQQKSLSDFLAGARKEFAAMNGRVVGGHTIVGPRMEVGFSVIGRTANPMLCKANLNVGDVLCMTKPLGIGVLLAAHMRSQCIADDYQAVISTMLQSQQPYIPIVRACGVTAMTDVTGFGLAGHLIEMLQESNVEATVTLDQITLLSGVSELIRLGVESSLTPQNLCAERSMQCDALLKGDSRYRALFDPQTCGGLLFGIASDQVQAMQQACESAGIAIPIQIGTVTAQSGDTKKVLTVQ